MQYVVWKYERAENKWTNVGEQQSMFKIVRLFVKFSRLRKIINSWSIVFFGLRNIFDLFGLRHFHALQNLENKWKLWTLKIFELSNLENFMRGLDL